MLTPQEVQQKKFEKAVFGGYDMSSVDDFLDALSEDYISLYKDNVALKAKMKLLVEKIEEYRSVDESMRKALLTAQNMANELVENAKKQASELTAHAREDADRKISSIKNEIVLEEKRLEEARDTTRRYISSIAELYRNGLRELEGVVEPEEAIPEKPDPVDEQDTLEFCACEADQDEDQNKPEISDNRYVSIEDIDKAVMAASEKAIPKPKTATEISSHSSSGMEIKVYEVQLGEKPAVSEDTGEIMAYTPKPKFNFENLKFGKDYRESDD